ncbi:hypothetical protein D3C76_295350 [compost metagenome]
MNEVSPQPIKRSLAIQLVVVMPRLGVQQALTTASFTMSAVEPLHHSAQQPLDMQWSTSSKASTTADDIEKLKDTNGLPVRQFAWTSGITQFGGRDSQQLRQCAT